MKLFLLFFAILIAFSNCKKSKKSSKVITCYYGGWASYRPGDAKFEPENIDAKLCTHVILSFASLDEANSNMQSFDPYLDFPDGKDVYNRMIALKKKNPKLKVMIAIGGYNDDPLKYSRLSSDPAKRKLFAKNAYNFINKYKFDGLDLDWEYPTQRGGSPADKANFVALVKDLRDVFKKKKLLTAALGAGPALMESSYDFPKLSILLDYLHMMCYDFHGVWDPTIGAHSGLYAANNDGLSVANTVQFLKSKNANMKKVVIGVPFYGKTFYTTKNPVTSTDIQNVNVESTRTGFKGRFNLENNFMGYNEICLEISDKNGWNYQLNKQTQTPFLFKGNQVITYDNPTSLRKKVAFVKKNKLAGIMIWSIETDDFNGKCTNSKYKNYPLLRTINSEMKK